MILMIERRHPDMNEQVRDLLTNLAVEINTSFSAGDSRTRAETPMSLRTVLDRYPARLRMYAEREDPKRWAWPEFILPCIDPYYGTTS